MTSLSLERRKELRKLCEREQKRGRPPNFKKALAEALDDIDDLLNQVQADGHQIMQLAKALRTTERHSEDLEEEVLQLREEWSQRESEVHFTEHYQLRDELVASVTDALESGAIADPPSGRIAFDVSPTGEWGCSVVLRVEETRALAGLDLVFDPYHGCTIHSWWSHDSDTARANLSACERLAFQLMRLPNVRRLLNREDNESH